MQDLGLSNWKNGDAIAESGAGGCGVQELRFGCTEFRGLLHVEVEMLR